jgi:hypothetical protein
MEDFRKDAYTDLEGPKELTPAEAKALEHYLGIGHQDINDAHRKGESLTPEVQESSDALDGLISRSRIKHDMDLKRGLQFQTPEERQAFIDTLQEDSIISDKGFVSTTGSEFVASSFGGYGPNAGVIFDIDVPEGSHGYHMHYGGQTGEDEVIFPRGSRLHVYEIGEEDNNGRLRVRARLLHPAEDVQTTSDDDTIDTNLPEGETDGGLPDTGDGPDGADGADSPGTSDGPDGAEDAGGPDAEEAGP